MKSLVKKLAAPLFGVIVIFNIYTQGTDEFITPYEIEQGKYASSCTKMENLKRHFPCRV